LCRRDAEHGVVDTVAFEPAVAQDLPGLHAGEDVLDAGSDVPVGGVVLLLPRRKFVLAALATVRDDQARAPVSTVGDDNGLPCSGLGSGQFPCLAVVPVAGQGSADGDDEPGVSVDDDLVVGGVPVVLRPLRGGVVAGGDQGACSPPRTGSLVPAEQGPALQPGCHDVARSLDTPCSTA
jgi:hypothetical protein